MQEEDDNQIESPNVTPVAGAGRQSYNRAQIIDDSELGLED